MAPVRKGELPDKYDHTTTTKRSLPPGGVDSPWHCRCVVPGRSVLDYWKVRKHCAIRSEDSGCGVMSYGVSVAVLCLRVEEEVLCR